VTQNDQCFDYTPKLLSHCTLIASRDKGGWVIGG
jgi:hypothetical protein